MKDNQLNRMEEMLGTLIKMVGENNSRLKTLEDKTDRLESKTDQLESKIDRLESKTDQLESKTDRLESKIDQLEGKTDRLESKTDKLGADMHEVKSCVKELTQGQERQDRILEMLSVKSIETDSYIQDFKRKM